MTNTRNLPIDASVVAVFTLTKDDRLDELVYVTKSAIAPNGHSVWVENADGQNTRLIGAWSVTSFGARTGDLAMSAALCYLGWGSLTMTDALDKEKAGA